MSTQIVPLKCPQCGGSSNIIAKELRIGFEFKCQFCSTSSILVINDQLYIPKPGERICLKCGRVSSPETRFCQCGTTLIQKCKSCHREISINNEICDYCGLPQKIKPSTIILKRNAGWVGLLRTMTIGVDGTKICDLEAGQEFSFELFEGEHIFEVIGSEQYQQAPIQILRSKCYRLELTFGFSGIGIKQIVSDE
jgi:hypothetical protein